MEKNVGSCDRIKSEAILNLNYFTLKVHSRHEGMRQLTDFLLGWLTSPCGVAFATDTVPPKNKEQRIIL